MKRYVKELALDMVSKTNGMQKEYKDMYMREVKKIPTYSTVQPKKPTPPKSAKTY